MSAEWPGTIMIMIATHAATIIRYDARNCTGIIARKHYGTERGSTGCMLTNIGVTITGATNVSTKSIFLPAKQKSCQNIGTTVITEHR